MYLAYGTDKALKNALQQGESNYRKGRLLDALQQLWESGRQQGPDEAISPQDIPARPAPQQSRTIAAILPQDHSQDPYYAEWSPLYKEMLHLRSKLPLYANDTDRGAAAFRILALETQCKYYWRKRDYFQQTGAHMPDDGDRPDMVTDRNALKEHQLNLRTYVTRYKKRLKGNPLDLVAQQKLDEYSRQLAEVDKKLER